MKDHTDRRREVCEIAARIIAREGIEGVTFRKVAREANCSTRIVSHYFANKRDLLLMLFREFSDRRLAEGERALARNSGLQEAFERLLPLDAQRRRAWQVWLAFWGTVANDREFIAEHTWRSRAMISLTQRLLMKKLATTAPSETDWELEAERVVTLLVGIATMALFDPQHWTPARMRRHLAVELENVLGRQPRGMRQSR
jgi:AcrR family transcriptional regulator